MHRPDSHTRRAWSDKAAGNASGEVRDALERAFGVTCPCCGYPLLWERGMYEICPLCWWEDDGLDDDAEGHPGDLDR